MSKIVDLMAARRNMKNTKNQFSAGNLCLYLAGYQNTSKSTSYPYSIPRKQAHGLINGSSFEISFELSSKLMPQNIFK